MSNRCGINGTAVVRLVNGTPEWGTFNDAIHVAEELRIDLNARLFIESKYVIGEWCDEVHAYHAHLRREPPL